MLTACHRPQVTDITDTVALKVENVEHIGALTTDKEQFLVVVNRHTVCTSAVEVKIQVANEISISVNAAHIGTP